jgi:hypothetical protein
LTVAPPPVIVTQPISQTRFPGETVIFSAAASGTPTPTVQWEVSTNGGVNFSNIPGATSTTLTLVASAALAGDEYEAVFTNPAGSATTNAATLDVPALTAVTSTTANGSYGVGTAINITLNFSEPVTLASGDLTVVLNNGATVIVAPFSDSASASGTYTVANGQFTAALDSTAVTLAVGATLEDAGGNAVDFAIPTGQSLLNHSTLTIETLPPVINPVSPQVVADDSSAMFFVTAQNPGGFPLTYTVAPGSPPGASINPQTGLFTWSPSEANGQAPGVYTFVISAAYLRTGQSTSTTVSIDVGPTSMDVGSGQAARLGVALGLTQSAEYYHNFVAQAYSTFLGRLPDATGLTYWVGLMQGGLSDEHLEAGFIGSTEYITKHGGPGAGWVQGMYVNLLGRTPASLEVQYWLKQLSSGKSTSDVAYGFAASQERESQRVQADYVKYLGRSASASEVSSWVNVFLAGGSNERVISGFVSSQEYFQGHGGDIVDWLFSAYRATLQRQPDAAGYQAWLIALE